jgi:hypothetical protein
LPFIVFIDSASLFNHIITFTYVYPQLILFSFSGLECKIIRSCSCHQLCLVQLALLHSPVNFNHQLLRVMHECLTIHILVFNLHSEWCHSHSCLKVIYQVLIDIMSATIDFNFFLFRLELVIAGFCTSFGLSTDLSTLMMSASASDHLSTLIISSSISTSVLQSTMSQNICENK